MHLTKLHVMVTGWCHKNGKLLLVYEYLDNNSLASVLFGNYSVSSLCINLVILWVKIFSGEFSGSENSRLNLDWPTRFRICLGIARGLAFLHEESSLKIVHRDIKATNVLLDGQLNPKISDFGLARLTEDEKTHISTRVAGTM